MIRAVLGAVRAIMRVEKRRVVVDRFGRIVLAGDDGGAILWPVFDPNDGGGLAYDPPYRIVGIIDIDNLA